MKLSKIALLPLMAVIVMMSSCRDHETYADQRKKENSAISAYLTKNNVKVIGEDEFLKDTTTDVSQNEFVLFNSSGVYMQIERNGCGKLIPNGKTERILMRFTERNLLTDTIQLSNDVLYYSSIADVMTVTNTLGTFSGAFESATTSLMYAAYQSASVPSAWLLPLRYIKVGRPVDVNDEIAKVRLIVPHSQGQVNASQNVYPCLYDITYELGKQ